MDKDTLTKIVITAVVTLIARELLSWFISTTKKLASTLRARVMPWINKDAQRFDLVLQTLSCIFFFWLFMIRTPPPGPVTYGGVHAVVFVGCVFFWELYSFVVKLKLYVNRRRDA